MYTVAQGNTPPLAGTMTQHHTMTDMHMSNRRLLHPKVLSAAHIVTHNKSKTKPTALQLPGCAARAHDIAQLNQATPGVGASCGQRQSHF